MEKDISGQNYLTLEKKYNQEKAKWEREKLEYQNLCYWYANSLKYQLGSLLINSIRRPYKLISFPYQSYKIFQTYKKNLVAAEGIESSLNRIIQEEDVFWRKYHYSDLKRTLHDVEQRKVSIIMPVYNASEETDASIRAVLQNTKFIYELIIIDDGSTEERINEILHKYQDHPRVTIIRNEQNMGFVAIVNKGMRMTYNDVVLLNSDTIVTKHWLRNLCIAAYSAEDIATATPFSNAAGAYSVPVIYSNNELPDDLSPEEMQVITKNTAEHIYERVFTGNGFCMYIKRKVLDELGYFDEESFGKGYGEENDLCMRFVRNGYTNIVCDDTFVYHRQSASFKKEKVKLQKEHQHILRNRYPDYDERILSFEKSQALNRQRERILQAVQARYVKRRILYVIMEATGGSVKTNEDMMQFASENEYEVFLLTGNGQELKLYQCKKDNLILMNSFPLDEAWDINQYCTNQYEDIYFDVMHNLQIDILHVRHFYRQSMDMIDVAKWLNIPVIISFHDFYCICPTANMMNDNKQYCHGQCSKREGNCLNTLLDISIHGNLQDWVVRSWRLAMEKMLKKCDAFITTSEYSKNLHIKFYPNITDRFYVIEHGRDFNYNRKFMGNKPTIDQKIKILLAGNINYNKGERYIHELINLDKEKRLEWHCIGIIPDTLKKDVIYYGKYLRDDFHLYVQKVRPSYVGIFSLWPETYCHVLSEAWSCGIPCIVSDIGTLHERAAHGGAILADLSAPEAAYKKILDYSYDENVYQKLCDEVQKQKLRSVAEMGNDYIQIYNRLINDDAR